MKNLWLSEISHVTRNHMIVVLDILHSNCIFQGMMLKLKQQTVFPTQFCKPNTCNRKWTITSFKKKFHQCKWWFYFFLYWSFLEMHHLGSDFYLLIIEMTKLYFSCKVGSWCIFMFGLDVLACVSMLLLLWRQYVFHILSAMTCLV